MKVSTEREALTEALGWVARVIPKRPSVPALAGAKLTADADGLTIRATDYDTAHQVALEAEVGEPGEVLLPGTFLHFAAQGGRGAETTLELADDAVTITSGRSTHKVRTLKLGDYPSFPDFPETVGTIEADDLGRIFGAISPASDDQNVHDNLAGVRLEADDQLEVVGLDRPRIHVVRADWNGKPFSATVTGRTFAGALKGLDGTVEIGHDGTTFGLRDETRAVTMRTIETPFADWRGALAHSEGQAKHKVEVDGSDLLAAVRAAGSLVESAPIELTFEKGELSISAGQEAGEGVEIITAKGRTAFALRFDPRLLADGLAATTGGPLELHYSGRSAKTSPLVIKDPAWHGLTVVVMTRSGAER